MAGSNLINYANFCQNIEQVFSDGVDIKEVIDNAKSTASFTSEERDALASLLNGIRTEIADKRILIKPQFQDYDRTKSSHITAEQFRRVLKVIGLIPSVES